MTVDSNPTASMSYENTSKIPSIKPESKHDLISVLEALIHTCITLIERNTTQPGSDKHENIYVGNAGIACAYLRLHHQHPHLCDPALSRKHVAERIHRHSPAASRLSPIGDVCGPAYVEMCLDQPDRKWKGQVTLENAITIACEPNPDGGVNEVLYGRAGLLWAILNLQKRGGDSQGKVYNASTTRALVERIIASGKRGRKLLQEEFAEEGRDALMWTWHTKMYLGAIHGAAGIITILLQAPAELIQRHMRELLATITLLCRLALSQDGHLPSSLPVKPRENPYVQICHGSPGLVLLLVTLKNRYPSHYAENPLFAEALCAASKGVWEKGILKKGLSLCHGAAGNAWVLLLLSQSLEGTEREKWLGRSLAMLLGTENMPPLGPEEKFRMPDHPLSLFEGTAGVIAACSEALCILKGEEDRVLGFPGLGGVGARGFL